MYLSQIPEKVIKFWEEQLKTNFLQIREIDSLVSGDSPDQMLVEIPVHIFNSFIVLVISAISFFSNFEIILL